MAFDANWAGMFGGGSYNRLRPKEEEEDGMPKPVSIDWSSFERPGPASQRYRQIIENAPKNPGPTKDDALAAGLVGFAQNFSRTGKGDETYEALANRPYHKMMEDFDKEAQLAHASAALENQDRDDMAKVLMGRERAYDRDLGRYYEGKRLGETIRAHDLENLDRDEDRETRRKNIEVDNARADKQLEVSETQAKTSKERLGLEREDLERRKAKDLLDNFRLTNRDITKSVTGSESRRGLSPSQQKQAEDLALRRLAQKNPEYYVDDGEGGKVLKPDLTPEERRALRKTQENLMSEIVREWENEPLPDDSDIDEDF